MPFTLTQGPAIQPAPELLRWLEGDDGRHRVQLPVVVVPSLLGLAHGYVAGSVHVDPAVSLHLKLDDTAMSVSLADTIRTDCPYDVPCAIWVEGFWGATLDVRLPGFSGPDLSAPETNATKQRHPFSVRRYVGLVTDPVTHARLVTNAD